MTSSNNASAAALPNDTYWGAVEREKLAETIRAKAMQFRKRLDEEGRIALWQRAERMYYGQDPDGGMANSAAVTFGGEEGEQVLLRVNHYRSIIKGLLATAANERPVFEARALSTDTEALGQARLGTSVIEAYWRTANLESIQRDVARMAVVLGEGATALRWNPSLGRVIATKQRPIYDDAGKPRVEMVEQESESVNELGEAVRAFEMVEQPVTEPYDYHEGDVEAQVFSPIEVIRDLDSPHRDLTWAILPYRENVWDLVARYPERRVELLNLRGVGERWPRSAWCEGAWDKPRADGDDVITVWWLYHMPTDALPKGRHAIVAGDVVVYDDVMPLGEVPVYVCMPEREMATASGHSPQFDLLGIQQAYDATCDVIVSSHEALGTQNIVAPDGTKVSPEDLGKGLRLLEYTPTADAPNNGKPEALQLLAIAPESFKILEIQQQQMETVSGLNSVARGDPDPQLKSGTALALVQSLAVEFNGDLQGEVVQHNERVATGLLKLLQLFADNKRMAEVVGRTKRAALAEWSKDAISKVSRVAVSIAAPLMQSNAGKMQAAQDLLQAKLITPQQYFEVLETGNLEPVYESDLSRVTYLRSENEMLMDGKPVSLSLFDDHAMHVREHLGCLDSPEIRVNPRLQQLVNDHVMEHIQAWSTMLPSVALLTRQSVMPLPPAPMPGPGGGSGEAGPPPPSGKGKPKPERAQPLGADGGPGMPTMPEPAQPPAGAPEAPIA